MEDHVWNIKLTVAQMLISSSLKYTLNFFNAEPYMLWCAFKVGSDLTCSTKGCRLKQIAVVHCLLSCGAHLSELGVVL